MSLSVLAIIVAVGLLALFLVVKIGLGMLRTLFISGFAALVLAALAIAYARGWLPALT